MYTELLETARMAARAGAQVVEGYFRTAGVAADQKGVNDFVTQADQESEAAILEIVRRRHPDHRILAEEGGDIGGDCSDFRWVVDPLDGTTNFMQGLPVFNISIACQKGDQAVVAVVLEPRQGNEFRATRGGGAVWNDAPMKISARDSLTGAFIATGFPFRAQSAIDTYLALFRDVYRRAKAIRRTGAAALDLAYTAAGVYDGFFEFRLSPWDIAAGGLLIEEAGGRVSDLDGGDSYLTGGNVIAGAAGVHADLLHCVARHTSEAHLDEVVPRESL